MCNDFVDRKYTARIAIIIPPPLSFARLSPAVHVFSGIFSVFDTTETQSFKVSCAGRVGVMNQYGVWWGFFFSNLDLSLI